MRLRPRGRCGLRAPRRRRSRRRANRPGTAAPYRRPPAAARAAMSRRCRRRWPVRFPWQHLLRALRLTPAGRHAKRLSTLLARRPAFASVLAVMHDASAIIETDVPARLDRLPWSRFHSLVIVALGITWILDGLEVTIAGSIVGALQESPVLHFTPQQIGLVATAYLAGAVVGALLFGYLTDRLGRRKLFFITLALSLTATAATALSWDFWSFALFRVLTGAGIGGVYVAMNSAIQELIPARYRGRVDLIISGSYWIGAALGSVATLVLLNPYLFPVWLGWRFVFGIGAALGL